ncbi:CHAT domain-containing protein [Streptomyces sp. NBC_01276]|uniref:CHAT domain-containing protein n=1 Tax=Streptomyces sp. NBC_01276 TaxID=2903808 RepID=UPI00352F9F01
MDALLDRARALFTLYVRDGNPRTFRQARLAAFTAEGATRFGGVPSQLAEAQWLYGHVCMIGGQRGHAGADALAEAEQRLREVVEGTATPAPLRSTGVDALAGVLLARHQATGNVSYLRDMRTMITRALDTLPEGADDDRVMFQSHLGVAETALARSTDDAALAVGAARRLHEALALVPEGSPEFTAMAAQAANAASVAAQLRGPATGERDAIDALVEDARRAVAAAERLDPDDTLDVLAPGAPYLHLCNALCLRFDAHRDREDLAEAERQVGRALTLVPEGNTARPVYLMARGSVAVRRHLSVDGQVEGSREEAGAHLDRAVADLLESVRLLPASAPDRPQYLGNLARVFQLRYQHDLLRTEDLREAIRWAEEAVEAVAESGGTAAAAVPLLNLCVVRVLAYQQSFHVFSRAVSPSQTALADAVGSMARALRELPGGHPSVANVHMICGQLFEEVFRRSSREADLDTALDAYAVAARHAGGSLLIRGTAAESGGLLAHRHGRSGTATALLALAVELLEAMTEPTLLGWHSRADHVEQFGGLAGQACAAYLQAGRPEDALAVLDRGRSLLLAPVWGLASRATALPEKDLRLYREAVWSSFRADQAAEAEQVTLAPRPLDPPPSPGPSRAQPTGPAATESGGAYTDAREHRRAAGRILAAYGSRLAPADVDVKALSSRLGESAVVALNVTALRADALIVTSGGVEALSLPRLTPEAVETYAARLQVATAARDEESLDVLDEITRRLWDDLAAPVLERLAPLRPDRVRWVPSGPLCLLPLHAAGHHGAAPGAGTTPDTVLDRVVSSYSATLRALARDLARPTEPVGPALLVAPGGSGRMGPVSVPAPLFDGPQALRLSETEAVADAVLAALPGRAVVHFACHGTSDASNPVTSALHLAGGDWLPFVSVARTDLGAARLAFLAACETALSGDRFADEALNMASAFQLAGFPHVIGTLWKVYGDATDSVARTVYAEIADGASPALALHRAVLELRAAQAASGADLGPLAWAPFLHLGV